ncbi:urease accessory protein UreD [Acidothermaceae bacterium B102]|nr:urease accessory protein UreD [Acidothermaceae bacterium B102]
MKARARVVAGTGGPYTAAVLRSDLPIVLRPADDAIHIAQGAAGPLGGDDVELSIEVPDGCWLRLRAVASTLVLPSVVGGAARITIKAVVGEGASLELLLEPVVVADRASVELVTEIELAGNARLLWREEVVLGRYNEQGGDAVTRIDVLRERVPLLRTGSRLVGGDVVTHGPAVLGRARAAGSLLRVGYDVNAVEPQPESALLTLVGGGQLVTVVASSAIDLRRALDAHLACRSESVALR